MSDPLQEATPSGTTAAENGESSLRQRFLIALGVCIALGLLFGGLTAWLLGPQLKTQEWLDQLHSLPATTAPTTPAVANSGLVSYKAKAVTKGTSPKQYALSLDGKKPSTPALIFGDPSQGKKMEVFLDPAGQHSADFLLLNKNTLASLVTSKRAYLVVHLTPTSNAYGLYSTEALYETATVDPAKTWGLMGELLRNGATVRSNQSKDMLAAVHTAVTKAGVSGVTKDTIQAGGFFSWALTAAQDPKTATGYALPVLYIDGKLVDSRRTNINDAETLRKLVMEG